MKSRKNLILAIITNIVFGCFINTTIVNAENNYKISLDFTNKLGADITNINVNGENWNNKNDIFYSEDDIYNINILYSNSTGVNPVIMYDDVWKGKIEEFNFCPKGCIYNLTVNNSSHNENLTISFTGGYTVNFETNGGSNLDSIFVELNNKLLKPTNPTKNGYVFDSWYEDDSLSIPFDFSKIINNNITLYAKWIEEYSINVASNDERMGTVSSNLEKAIEGTKIVLTAEPKNGYHFVKWSSMDIDASNGQFNMPASNVTIVAIFEKNPTYSISFVANGGSGTMEDIHDLESLYTLPENRFVSPIGKRFKGWSLNNDGEIITELEMNENKIVYAIWEDIPYTYSFIEGNNQKLTLDEIEKFNFTIDGNYYLFESLKIGDLDLIKDEDYKVTEGSTIISFTDKGLAKLNTLSKGEYEVLVKYQNGEEVKGKLTINKNEENPKTGDKIIVYLIIGSISLISIFGYSFYINHKKSN